MAAESLAGWPLSVAVARAGGWREVTENVNEEWQGYSPTHHWKLVPAYHESLDACFRDLLPALRETFPTLLIDCRLRRDGEWEVDIQAAKTEAPSLFGIWHVARGVGSCAAEAFCRALLAAMDREAAEAAALVPWDALSSTEQRAVEAHAAELAAAGTFRRR